MKIAKFTNRIPPPKLVLFLLSMLLAFLLGLLTCPASAHADENTEPGTVYVQHRFNVDSHVSETQPIKAFSTYFKNKSFYTARINASNGAVEGTWKATANHSDITDKCFYVKKSGLVVIPREYLNTPVYITLDVNDKQSTKLFDVNVNIISGTGKEQTHSTSIPTFASNLNVAIPISGRVKAVTQDSRVLDSSEYRVDGAQLTIKGTTALSGSYAVYLDSFEPEINSRNPIQDSSEFDLKRSAFPGLNSSHIAQLSSPSSFAGWGTIHSTNPGPGDWDYTDYVLDWWGGTFYLTCCQHGVYHMPEGSVWFSATYTGTTLINSYDTMDESTVYHHSVYRDNYYIYVSAGVRQDVDGTWSEDHEDVRQTPRVGGLDLCKASANAQITDGSSSYSIAGALYGIFSDSDASTQINSVTTNAEGWAGTWDLNAGKTVYVKEINASTGYNLDPTIYPVYITADQWNHVNSGKVYEPPKTLSVRYFVDNATSAVYTDENLPLGTEYSLDTPALLHASELAKKPNCTPGLSAWHTDIALSKKYNGSTLLTDLDLYARNVATLSYALCPASILTEDLEIHPEMSKSSPLLKLHHDILPKQRQAYWGSKIKLIEPKYSTIYHHDTQRWRTLRKNTAGWYGNTTLTGTPLYRITIDQDTTVFTDFTMSTFDGIVMW